jgi:hypothetical protein
MKSRKQLALLGMVLAQILACSSEPGDALTHRQESATEGSRSPSAAPALGGGTAGPDCNDADHLEGCPCTAAGETHECYVEDPAQAGVGECNKGVQTCLSSDEFGRWGACVGETHATFAVAIAADTADFDLQTALEAAPYNWNGTSPVTVSVTVASGVSVSASSAKVPAFSMGTLPACSQVTIVNQGSIVGAGGAGGAGGGGAPTAGQAGGTAIAASARLFLDNTSGNIWGGGGGGGGGALATIVNVMGGGGGGGGGAGASAGAAGSAGIAVDGVGAQYVNGSGGSGGQRMSGGAGGAGGSSGYWPTPTSGGVGIGGTGGAGGNLGMPGTPGGNGNLGGKGAPGGAAGNAVELNGNVMSWLGGNNATQVLGPVN